MLCHTLRNWHYWGVSLSTIVLHSIFAAQFEPKRLNVRNILSQRIVKLAMPSNPLGNTWTSILNPKDLTDWKIFPRGLLGFTWQTILWEILFNLSSPLGLNLRSKSYYSSVQWRLLSNLDINFEPKRLDRWKNHSQRIVRLHVPNNPLEKTFQSIKSFGFEFEVKVIQQRSTVKATK